MAKKFRLKWLILCMALLAAITSATIFTASYARWSNSGAAQFSAAAKTGVWAKDLTQMTDDEILESISNEANASGDKYGGVAINDGSTDGRIIGVRWNPTFPWVSEGYSIELTLKQGDSFVVAIFNRVWEDGKRYANNGSCVLNNNTLGAITVNGKIFTANADCTITLEVREGGRGENDDIVTVRLSQS